MKLFLKKFHSAILTAAALSALPLPAQTFLDKFTDEAIFESDNIPTGVVRTDSSSGLAGVLGGERLFSETRIATLPGSSPAALSHGATIEPGFGFSFLNGNISRNEVGLAYGLSTGVKFDFSAYAAGGSLRLADWFSDGSSVQLELTLRSNVGNGTLESSQSQSVFLPTSFDPTHVDFAFALYDQIDFANIDDITLKFTSLNFASEGGASALMVQIPEPGTYALLMGLATIGLIRFRRRGLASRIPAS